MKIFFADDVDGMITELRSQAVKTVRVHVMRRLRGDTLALTLHLTAYCNNQVYESMETTRHSVTGLSGDQLTKFAEEKCLEARRQFIDHKLRGLEVKAGILQSA